MPLEIKPTKGGTTTLYLRIPKDVMKMYGIDQNTKFTFEIIEDPNGTTLVYKARVHKKE